MKFLLFWFLSAAIGLLSLLPPSSWLKSTTAKRKETEEEVPFSMATFLQEVISWLEAGTSPTDVFTKVTNSQKTEKYFYKVNQAIAANQSVDLALKEHAHELPQNLQVPFLQLGRAWHVSAESGCSLHQLLEEAAAHFEDIEEQERHIKQAVSAPLTSAKVLLFLPVLSLGMSTLMGLIDLSILITSPFAIGAIVFGCILNLIAYGWSKSMLKEISP